MASLIKKIFGSSSKDPEKKSKGSSLPVSETPESIRYWDNEIVNTIPSDVINRGIIESAYKGNLVHQSMLGLAFLPYSKEHAKAWLEKASARKDVYSKDVLNDLEKGNSNKYIMIWWSLKDFTNIVGYPRISTINRATVLSLNTVAFRNAILVPFLDDVVKNKWSHDYFEYIHDHIDSDIIPDSEVICVALEDEAEDDEESLEELFEGLDDSGDSSPANKPEDDAFFDEVFGKD